MKKLLALFLCFGVLFIGGCGKTDEEKYTELTEKFCKEFQLAETKEQREKLIEDYKQAIPKSHEVKADGIVTGQIFVHGWEKRPPVKFGDGNNVKLGNY